MHNSVMQSRTDIYLAVTHAAEATAQRDTCSCTRHIPRRVPRPCPCTTGVMKSTTDHLSAVTHAAEAATQETHCCCTRHVPRRVPRPCPCTTGVMKSRTDHFISSDTHAAEAMPGTEINTLQLHKARTKARASSMPVHNRCNKIRTKQNIYQSSHMQRQHRRHTASTHRQYQGTCLHASCTNGTYQGRRHVPRPRPCPCTTV